VVAYVRACLCLRVLFVPRKADAAATAAGAVATAIVTGAKWVVVVVCVSSCGRCSVTAVATGSGHCWQAASWRSYVRGEDDAMQHGHGDR
jgi:hypothetical protein